MHGLSAIVRKRQVLREYVNVWPQRLTAPPGVFAASYRSGASELLVFVNITDGRQSIKINVPLLKEYAEMLRLHECELGGDEITRGAYAGIWLQK